MERANVSSRGNCDFISNLPDPILHQILGLLKTKQAVQMCALSKRWEHLWISIPSLKFNAYDAEYLDEFRRFVKFVNTLLLRRKPLDLDVFHLSSYKFWPKRYARYELDWVRYAMNHNVRVLNLTLSGPVQCRIPSCIYTCTSLEELYLCDPTTDLSAHIVNLPNLRKLSICIANLTSNYVKKLLSGCTILDVLWLDTCFFYQECVTIDHECLKHLTIINCLKDGTGLFINAPNLLSFYYDGELSLPYKTTLNMPSLESSCLVSRDCSMIKCLEGMATCLRFLTNAEILELHFERRLCEELSTAVFPLELPMFQNLKNVTVAFCMFSCFQIVTLILKSSPNLKKLMILQEGCLSIGEEGASTNESTNTSLTIAVSPHKKLKIEVKYWRSNQMVRRLIDTLKDGTKELENVKIRLSKYKSSEQYLG